MAIFDFLRSVFFLLVYSGILSQAWGFNEFLESYSKLENSLVLNSDNFLQKAALSEDPRILFLLDSFSQTQWLREKINLKTMGKTPLEIAMENNNDIEIIEFLKMGAVCEDKEKFYNYLLNNDDRQFLLAIRELRDNQKIDIDSPNDNGENILHMAAKMMNIEFIKLFALDENINNCTFDEVKKTILHIICGITIEEFYEFFNKQISRLSIYEKELAKKYIYEIYYHGSNLESIKNFQNIELFHKENLSSLQWKMLNTGISGALMTLIELGADPKRTDGLGLSPLFYAYQVQSKMAIISLLPYFDKESIKNSFNKKEALEVERLRAPSKIHQRVKSILPFIFPVVFLGGIFYFDKKNR